MALQALTLSLVACETSLDKIESLISGCQLGEISGTVNAKYRDFAAEDILEALHNKGFKVQRAEHLHDDGASMLNLTLFVPDERKVHVEEFIADFNDSDITAEWGVSVGDAVDVETKDGVLNIEFRGTVVGFKDGLVQVRDMEDDVFDVALSDVKSI